MRVLVTETDQYGSDAVAAELTHAGHQVVRCVAEDGPAFPCHGLTEGSSCPVDGVVDVVVTVRNHPYPRRTAREDGVVCALRRHIPLVVTGTQPINPFAEWTTVHAEHDVVAACEDAAAAPLRRHSEIATAEVVRLLGDETAGAVAHRRGKRIVVTLNLPDSVTNEEAHRIAVRVAAAVHGFDPHAANLDVQLPDHEANR